MSDFLKCIQKNGIEMFITSVDSRFDYTVCPDERQSADYLDIILLSDWLHNIVVF